MLALIKSVCTKTSLHFRAYGPRFYDRVYLQLGVRVLLCDALTKTPMTLNQNKQNTYVVA